MHLDDGRRYFLYPGDEDRVTVYKVSTPGARETRWAITILCPIGEERSDSLTFFLGEGIIHAIADQYRRAGGK